MVFITILESGSFNLYASYDSKNNKLLVLESCRNSASFCCYFGYVVAKFECIMRDIHSLFRGGRLGTKSFKDHSMPLESQDKW